MHLYEIQSSRPCLRCAVSRAAKASRSQAAHCLSDSDRLLERAAAGGPVLLWASRYLGTFCLRLSQPWPDQGHKRQSKAWATFAALLRPVLQILHDDAAPIELRVRNHYAQNSSQPYSWTMSSFGMRLWLRRTQCQWVVLGVFEAGSLASKSHKELRFKRFVTRFKPLYCTTNHRCSQA